MERADFSSQHSADATASAQTVNAAESKLPGRLAGLSNDSRAALARGALPAARIQVDPTPLTGLRFGPELSDEIRAAARTGDVEFGHSPDRTRNLRRLQNEVAQGHEDRARYHNGGLMIHGLRPGDRPALSGKRGVGSDSESEPRSIDELGRYVSQVSTACRRGSRTHRRKNQSLATGRNRPAFQRQSETRP